MTQRKVLPGIFVLTATLLCTSLSFEIIAAPVVDQGPLPGSDFDGDGVPYNMDNAAWLYNPTQIDADADGLGGDGITTIDPDDTDSSAPVPADLTFSAGGPYTITAGDTLNIDLSGSWAPPLTDVPLEIFGHVGFALDDASGLDAFLLPFDSVATISPDFLIAAGWDLNTPGTYDFTAQLINNVYGVFAAANGTVTVTAVPLPAAFWLLGSGLLGLVGMARRKKA